MSEPPETEEATSSRVYARRGSIHRYLAICMAEVERLGGLPTPREAREMWGDIWLRETHHSTGIEGNTLTYTEVEALLHENQAVQPDQYHDYLEVRGYADAAQWVYTLALEPEDWTGEDLLSVTEVRHVHHVALAPVWEKFPHPDASDDERPGSFRRHDIQAFPGGMQPPSWPEVPSLLSTWIERVNAIPQEEGNVLELVGQRHAEFEHIHPFLDGNGRTGRLLLNLLLVRLRYPPAIIFKERRSMYLDALRACDSGDAGPLGETIAKAVIGTLKLTVFPCIAGPGRYILLSVLADEQFSTDKLRRAVLSGKLVAQKDEDGFWRSTPKFVEQYKASCRHKDKINTDEIL